MSHAARLVKEQAVQIMAVGVSFLDRILLTAVLVRAWDVSAFEQWSAALALAGLMSLFEFGFNLYFNNRLTIETERGEQRQADRTIAIANFIFALCGAAGVACVSVLLAAQNRNSAIAGAVLLLAIAAGLRISLSGVYGLYRANRQFARLTLIMTSGEALRILATAAVVFGGGQLLPAAAATLAAVALAQYGFVLRDATARFAPHRYGFALPTWLECRYMLAISTGYFAQNVPVTLLTHLPALVLLELQAGPGVVSVFVLLRTLTGLPRSILQSLGVVPGQECGRLIAVGDTAGAFAVLAHGSRAFGAMSGLCSGFLLSAGVAVGTVWTGKAGLVQFPYLAAGLAPMLLISASVLALNILASTNTPFLFAAGRWVQLAATVVIAIAAPVDDLALRVLLALSLGEIAGFAPLVYLGLARLIPQARLRFHAMALGQSLAAAVWGLAATSGLLRLLQPETTPALVSTLGLCLAACAPGFVLLGLSRPMRAALLAHAAGIARAQRQRLFPRSAN